ncbi:hypothetical protein Hypma_005207 [Hypsizygus marmoreus]|uniref:Uncharacterized protein n=1 Tax=Hypsizygus marmoreus TaxID=39966 RepID=A0A369K7K1_HYPMA|nr:hypothetical protein Hypma_005207 [Hypsizygus marmoreus]
MSALIPPPTTSSTHTGFLDTDKEEHATASEPMRIALKIYPGRPTTAAIVARNIHFTVQTIVFRIVLYKQQPWSLFLCRQNSTPAFLLP